MWTDTRYEPGEVKVVAYDDSGKALAERIVPHGGKTIAVITPNRGGTGGRRRRSGLFHHTDCGQAGSIVVPTERREVRFTVTGSGRFAPPANGDPRKPAFVPAAADGSVRRCGNGYCGSRRGAGHAAIHPPTRGVKPATATITVKINDSGRQEARMGIRQNTQSFAPQRSRDTIDRQRMDIRRRGALQARVIHSSVGQHRRTDRDKFRRIEYRRVIVVIQRLIVPALAKKSRGTAAAGSPTPHWSNAPSVRTDTLPPVVLVGFRQLSPTLVLGTETASTSSRSSSTTFR